MPALSSRCSSLAARRCALRPSASSPCRPWPCPIFRQSPADLAESESVRLFVERARAVRADFALSESNVAVVAEVCRRLDGLPLAIELAAARVTHLPPAALLARLDRRLPLLTGGPRDLPARQQTIRATIAWSHDLLTPEEQVLFRRLAVFVGGVSLEAVEPVAGTPEGSEVDILDGVASLVAKSLLRAEDDPDVAPRYRMLETVREYAAEQLDAAGEAEEVRRRHAAWCLALAERAKPPAWREPVPAALDLLERDLGNLRTAIEWYLTRREAAAAQQMASDAWAFWWLRGRGGEGLSWLERALALGGAAIPDARARALFAFGLLAYDRNDYVAATAAEEEALALFRMLGDAHGRAHALWLLGWVALDLGDFDEATRRYEEARDVALTGGDPEKGAVLTNYLGLIALIHGDLERAVALLGDGLLCRASGWFPLGRSGVSYAPFLGRHSPR